MGVTYAMVSLSKTESHNIRELMARYILTMDMSKSMVTWLGKANRDRDKMAPTWRRRLWSWK